jgi:putative membrane protein
MRQAPSLAEPGADIESNGCPIPMTNALLTALVVVIAIEHFWFLVLEMFLWTRPIGLRTFRNSPEFARQSATLAANQGLSNGFLAVGLLWGAFHPHPHVAFQLRVFFLACVAVAGVYGAITVSKRILYVQAVPALLGLALTWLHRAA